MKKRSKGWRNEPLRHSLARKGVKTGRKSVVKPRTSYPLSKREQDSRKIAYWLLDNSEYYFDKALFEANGDKNVAYELLESDVYFEEAFNESEKLPSSERKSILKQVKK